MADYIDRRRLLQTINDYLPLDSHDCVTITKDVIDTIVDEAFGLRKVLYCEECIYYGQSEDGDCICGKYNSVRGKHDFCSRGRKCAN